MNPPTVEKLRHVATEFLRHQHAGRVADYRGNQARSNNDYKKPVQTASAPSPTAAATAGEIQPRLEAQPADPNPTGEDGQKRQRFPNLRKLLEEIVSFFRWKRATSPEIDHSIERLY